MKGLKVAGALVVVVLFLSGIDLLATTLREESSKAPIVATAAGEEDCGADHDMALKSVSWSANQLVVDASQVFAKGTYEPLKPSYVLKDSHLHIAWTWVLLPGAPQAPCLAEHKVRIEIRGIRPANYAIHLEPIIMQ